MINLWNSKQLRGFPCIFHGFSGKLDLLVVFFSTAIIYESWPIRLSSGRDTCTWQNYKSKNTSLMFAQKMANLPSPRLRSTKQSSWRLNTLWLIGWWTYVMRPSRVTRSHFEPQQVVITDSPLSECLPPPSQENQAANVARHLKRPPHSHCAMSHYATPKKYADLSSLPSGPAP